jgi:hypothetical protein
MRFQKFEGREFVLTKAQYDAGERCVLVIMDPHDDLYALVTTNIPKLSLKDDEPSIKNWPENEGITQPLLNLDLFEGRVKKVRSGFVLVPVWRMRDNARFFIHFHLAEA